MKTNFMALLFTLAPVLAAFGADFSLSAGGGAFTGGFFTRYTLSGTGSIADAQVDVRSIQEINQFNYGGFLFFDATWLEFSLSFQWGTNTWMETTTAESGGKREIDIKNEGVGLETMLGFTLLGKYPFALTRQLSLFPLAGLEYQIVFTEYRKKGNRKYDPRTKETDSSNKPYKLSAWNSLFVDIGGGLDFGFIPSLFLRTELVYAFRLMTPYEVDALEKIKKMVNAPDPKLAGLTSGPVLKVSLGYRF
jgi:hypothetical protein